MCSSAGLAQLSRSEASLGRLDRGSGRRDGAGAVLVDTIYGSTSLLNQGGWSGVEWSGKADKDRGSDDEQVGRG